VAKARMGVRGEAGWLVIRICLEPGCPSEASYRGRCVGHSRTRERATHQNASFYNTKRWQMARRKQLFDHPLCQCDDPACTEIASDVDHVRPLEKGGAPYAPSNLQSLAHGCHARKTRREQVTT
jgi:5-methylcytosine-specific restriction endonuclease McrA